MPATGTIRAGDAEPSSYYSSAASKPRGLERINNEQYGRVQDYEH
jgi:hypothetical protein